MGAVRNKKWILPEEDTGFQREQLPPGVSEVVGRLLFGRGVRDKEQVTEFLSPKPQQTYDPFLMKDVAEGAARIIKALEQGETICIYGDYDADGVTSCSIMISLLRKLTDRLFYYIPSRFDEGYGLNGEAVKTIAGRGAKLLITVDCGSVSYSEVEEAKELGMDVIVTDHHNINGGKAADCLLINPKQEDCSYPFKELAGCGVAFKLLQGLQRTMEKKGDSRLKRSDITETLDLVAVATIGDIVPLVGENRSLVKYGLNVLNQGKRPGLRALIDGVGLTLGKIKAEQVAYIIVPHLNAAGRMISAEKGVELLTDHGPDAQSDERRKEAVAFLVENNKERKRIQEETFQSCKEILEGQREDIFQVIFAPEAHEGIAGIVAGKIKDTVYRPTIITTPSGDGFLKGTGRSLVGVDLYEMLSAHRSLFQRFGGHSGACGFLMKEEHLQELRDSLNRELKGKLEENPELLTETVSVESRIEPDQLTEALIRETELMGPFGHCNPEPLYAIEGLRIRKVSFMGDRGQHVRFQAQRGTTEFGCVFFQQAADYEDLLIEGNAVDIAGYPGLNVWNGTTKIQFVIRHMK